MGEANAWEVEPFSSAIWSVASYHLSIGYLVAVAVPHLVWLVVAVDVFFLFIIFHLYGVRLGGCCGCLGAGSRRGRSRSSLSGGSLLSLGLFFSFWLRGRAMLVIRGILASEDSSVDAEDGFLASSYQRTFRKWIYLTITWTFSFSPFSFSTSMVIRFWPFQP